MREFFDVALFAGEIALITNAINNFVPNRARHIQKHLGQSGGLPVTANRITPRATVGAVLLEESNPVGNVCEFLFDALDSTG